MLVDKPDAAAVQNIAPKGTGVPARFEVVSEQALAILAQLATPLYVYCFESERICWSNEAARAFWSAETPDELHERPVAPQLAANRSRLSLYREAFRRGETRKESWTFFPHGEPLTALCYCRGVSITGHPEAMLVELIEKPQNRLQDTELRTIEALRHTPLMISLFDENGNVLLRNPAASAQFADFDLDCAPTVSAFDAMFSDSSVSAGLRNLLDKHGFAETTSKIAISRNPVHHLQVTLVADAATGRPALLVAQQDVTESIETSRKLAASEDALDHMLDLNLSPVIVVAATTGHLIRCNHAAEVLLGIEGSVTERDIAVFAQDQDYRTLLDAIAVHGFASGQNQLLKQSGNSFWAHLSGTCLRYRDTDASVFFLADIDQLYRTTHVLEEELVLARQTSDMQRRLMAVASHEFRTPLAMIDSAAQRIEAGLRLGTPDQIKAGTGRIRTVVKRLMALMDRTLMGQSADEGRDHGFVRKTDIARLIGDCVRSVREMHPDALITLDLPPLPALAADRSIIESVISNLLGNAIKYSNGPARIDVSCQLAPAGIEITIRDEGIGIPLAERDTVFGEFVRGSNVGNREGTGLGLAIVRNAIEALGGTIELLPDCRVGAAFRIILPRKIFA